MPGDEISEIDWKVYGRSDKLFVKLFEHQSDLSVNLLIDASASMDYRGVDRRGSMGESALAGSATSTSSGGGGDRQSWLEEVSLTKQKRTTGRDRATIEHPSKYDQACLMAAAIAFLVTKQQDRVGFGVAQRGLEHCHRPLGTIAHLNNVLETMERVRPGGEAHLAETLRAVAQRTSRRGLLVVFSDLLEDQDSIMRALAIFTHRGNEVIVFQVLHADELRLPDLASAVFVDSETDQRLRLNVDDVAPAYEKRLNDFLSGWAGACRNRGIDYNLVSTATAYHKAMERYLFGRANRM
jgi:uncharacterized protein (DUF58 family)